MKIQLFFPDGSEVSFHDTSTKRYRGILLPGSRIKQSTDGSAVITIQEFENRLFTIGYRIFQLIPKLHLNVRERLGLRLEALIEGELDFTAGGKNVKLKKGEYHLTDLPSFISLFKTNTATRIFVTYYSRDLLDQLGIEVTQCLPQKMPEIMAGLIEQMLHNPYEEKLRQFYYENCVRELLFFHIANDMQRLPANLENKDITAIYKADSIIASNLQTHFTIDKLSRMTGTNQFKLKRGFSQVFGMGVFRRLLFRRMEQAKTLLENTKKPIGEIAEIAGYDTAAGFIHAFRREFGMTPREWRQQSSNKGE